MKCLVCKYTLLTLLPKHDLQYLIYIGCFLLLKQSVNDCDLYCKSTFGCGVLNFEEVVLQSERSFPTWQLRQFPASGEFPTG